MHIRGHVENAADTTDTNLSHGIIALNAGRKSGTTSSTEANAGAIFTVENSGNARLLLKGNGDLHVTNTTLTALDEYNDRHLLRVMDRDNSARGIIDSKWDDLITDNAQVLKDVGVLSSQGHFVIQQQFNKLISGGVWQNYTDIMEARSRQDVIEDCLRFLVEENPEFVGREQALALLAT